MRAWVLALALTAVGCRSAERGALRVDPTLAAMVSSDTVVLAGARMDALRATPLYRKFVAARPQPMLDRLSARLGLDPRKDLGELLVASDGKATVALARGKFATAETRLGDARRLSYKGHTLIGDERAALLFLNASTVAAGPAPALRALIDRRNRNRRPSPLLARAASLPAGVQLWMVASQTAPLAEALPSSGNLAVLAKILAMLESCIVAVDLRSGLHLNADCLSRNENDARTLSDALRGLVGLARLSTPDDAPELLRAYDRVKVEQTQRTIRLKAEIPEDLLEALAAHLEKGRLAPPELKRRLPGL